MSKNGSGSDVVTKDFFVDTLHSVLDVRLGMLKGEITRETREIITENNSIIFERIDPILSEVENARVDRELATHKLEDLDKRVTKLETS